MGEDVCERVAGGMEDQKGDGVERSGMNPIRQCKQVDR